jgi:preprotein translocase subunit SecA
MVIQKISEFLLKVFGSRNERIVKNYMEFAHKCGEFEEQIRGLSDEELAAKTTEFKKRLANGESDRSIMPEAFAVVRETAWRKVNMRHYDVQLVGGAVLYDGKIAEMATGEGKTLVATLAAYMVFLTGRKVHIITVNDYLAKRDAEWMGPVYEALGMTVGVIQADMDTRGAERKQQYQCDITYGTNNEFGFDYLRDNMKTSIEQMVQGPLEYAIIDEVDSILIDEARTPLIISGPAFDDVTRYKKADSVARELINLQRPYSKAKADIDAAEREIANCEGELSEAKKQKDESRAERARKKLEENEKKMVDAENRMAAAVQYYEVEVDRRAVHLTHEGIGKAQELAGVGSFFTGSNMEWPHMLEQSLRAHTTFQREKDYVVIEGKVVIVDEFTGRLMHGRQWSDGLHQAVEAKENVKVKEESQTLATITLQNFFKLYDQIAGMTGTAETEADEFMEIYGLDVVVMPTNKPCIRDDRDDMIYKTMPEKFNAIVDDIYETSSAGRPVLVGTISIEKSEAISNALKTKHGLDHEVLNAKQHQREASIVEKAGQQHTGRDGKTYGNVTIATNMAGRGTDIKLGPGVAEIGGLHIVGTERHEARRIDNQLRGRAGRQGDAGSSVFFLSFEDDLLKTFAPEWTIKALSWIGWQEGEPIYHSRISKGIEKAQKKVEEKNFDIRKSLLEYDEVMDYQRKVFYSRRRKILEGRELRATINEMIEAVIDNACENFLDENYPLKCICEWSRNTFRVEPDMRKLAGRKVDEIEELIKKQARADAANEITLSIGEYLEDYEDKSTWNVDGLCKWAMSTFNAGLTVGKLRKMDYDEIKEAIIEAAETQIDNRDCSTIAEYLKEGFAIKTFLSWANNKFDINLKTDEFKDLSPEQIKERLRGSVNAKYTSRQIEYPVEFALNMAFGQGSENVYGFSALADWANKKYRAGLDADELQNMTQAQIERELLNLSRAYNDGKLEEEIEEARVKKPNIDDFLGWANARFNADIDAEQLDADTDGNGVKGSNGGKFNKAVEKVTEVARQFIRKELIDMEKYVLLQILDSTWKEHLYAMDHLKESIFLRAFAEKDPKLEYKQEGFRMFHEMLDQIDDKVTDTIFKVRLDAGTQTRSVWNVSSTKHDEVDQFAMTERQRAAAQAPQNRDAPVATKQIKLETPKVGRNDPCPCGSGKKYKKCCGRPT